MPYLLFLKKSSAANCHLFQIIDGALWVNIYLASRKTMVIFAILLLLLFFPIQEWVVLGSLDLEVFVEEHLKDLSDWERNFKALKLRGRDAEKLPR